ncbi:hypothetical protein AJ79_07762 [Helicocarpus griseus UAMH5409]|uniref:Uncharacterized protein n=1 Tax=Helicocarpus griseus UAMH5409 TaxID=1447875 RepID=A0A2B7WZG2_9EURO|nr:hypothetical protein AJ79_07762 [Helicocarpus griseus UAMH5409]
MAEEQERPPPPSPPPPEPQATSSSQNDETCAQSHELTKVPCHLPPEIHEMIMAEVANAVPDVVRSEKDWRELVGACLYVAVEELANTSSISGNLIAAIRLSGDASYGRTSKSDEEVINSKHGFPTNPISNRNKDAVPLPRLQSPDLEQKLPLYFLLTASRGLFRAFAHFLDFCVILGVLFSSFRFHTTKRGVDVYHGTSSSILYQGVGPEPLVIAVQRLQVDIAEKLLNYSGFAGTGMQFWGDYYAGGSFVDDIEMILIIGLFLGATMNGALSDSLTKWTPSGSKALISPPEEEDDFCAWEKVGYGKERNRVPLIDAVDYCDVEMVQLLLNSLTCAEDVLAAINEISRSSMTALECAARKGDEVIVRYLLEHGAEVRQNCLEYVTAEGSGSMIALFTQWIAKHDLEVKKDMDPQHTK